MTLQFLTQHGETVKIIAGLFGRTCFIWHVLGKSSTKGENKVAMFMAAGLSVRW